MGAYDEPKERTLLDAIVDDWPDRRKLIDAHELVRAFLSRHCRTPGSDIDIVDDKEMPKTCRVLAELSILLRKAGEATEFHEEVDFFERAGWFKPSEFGAMYGAHTSGKALPTDCEVRLDSVQHVPILAREVPRDESEASAQSIVETVASWNIPGTLAQVYEERYPEKHRVLEVKVKVPQISVRCAEQKDWLSYTYNYRRR